MGEAPRGLDVNFVGHEAWQAHRGRRRFEGSVEAGSWGLGYLRDHHASRAGEVQLAEAGGLQKLPQFLSVLRPPAYCGAVPLVGDDEIFYIEPVDQIR
jgi:hypothetical protein